MSRTITALAGGVLISVPLLAGTAQAATHYTHSTTLRHSCAIHDNFPKAGVPDRTWPKAQKNSSGHATHVGVRYTYKGYARCSTTRASRTRAGDSSPSRA
jgi:hypothetical protein